MTYKLLLIYYYGCYKFFKFIEFEGDAKKIVSAAVKPRSGLSRLRP